jgi:hypothetical protein
MIRFLRLLLYLSLLAKVSVAWGQKSDPKIEAIERHYQNLEIEAKSSREWTQKETEIYRKFIQDERAEHQKFLEYSYTVAGFIVSAIIVFLSFFGLNTFKGIRDSRKELEAAAAGRLLAFENSMSDYRVRFDAAQLDLERAKLDYNHFLSYYKDINPIKGRYLLIGLKSKLDIMSGQEIPRFETALGKLDLLTTDELSTNGFYEGSYDVIIYRYSPNEKGEDVVLESILNKLETGVSVPVLVYSVGQSEYIKGSTDEALKRYSLFHVANNPVTLIDNTASTYRVSKLLPKPTKTA